MLPSVCPVWVAVTFRALEVEECNQVTSVMNKTEMDYLQLTVCVIVFSCHSFS